MYTIYLDDEILYYPGDDVLSIVGDPVIKLAIGQAGSCEITVPPANPCYDSIQNRKSMITVFRDSRNVFSGEVRETDKDRMNCKKVYAVGELAFLQDSIQPQHYYGDVTPTNFLTAVLAEHNDCVEYKKQFTAGLVTVTSGWDQSLKVTDHNSTLEALREQLIGNLGGCFRIRKQSGTRYLEYVNLSDYGAANRQGINFGENLLDYSETLTASDIVTCIIPLGKRTDSQGDFETRIDIKSVNDGCDYLTASQTVLNRFGYVWKVVVFDDLEDPADIMAAGQDWLTEAQYETLRLKLTAMDLSMLDADMDAMNLGDRIPCKAEPYGLNMTLPIIEQTLHPLAPQKDTIVLSATLKNKQTTISDQVGSGGDSIRQATAQTELKIRNVIRQEVANLMARFAGTNGGYKLSEFDANGLWLRDLWMDTPDKTTATNILEISMNGIRSSNAGYKPATDPAWKLGITIDGQINADRILTGTLMAGLIKAGILSDVGGNTAFNLETGALTSTKFSINSPRFSLTEAGIASMTGATINDGSIISTSGDKKATLENGFYRGYLNNQISGLLDLCPTYSDGIKRAALWGKDILYLQAGGSEGTPTTQIIVDSTGLHGDIHAQGLTGWTNLGGMRVRLEGGLVMEII
jgi:phage minor structural protein